VKILFHILLVVLGLIVALALVGPRVFADKRPATDRRLCSVLHAGDTNRLGQYIASGGNVDRAVQYMPFGKISAPLIDIAIEYGQLDALDFLLKKGANPNQPDSQGETPLIWATGRVGNEVPHETRVAMFKALLNVGADPNLKSSSGFWTPLIHATTLSQTNMVCILLTAGAEVNGTNCEGQTALQYADTAEVARLLIAAGADRTNRMGGETPAESAIRRGRVDVLAVLTNAPINTNR
jgi:ankyrin repeat protein